MKLKTFAVTAIFTTIAILLNTTYLMFPIKAQMSAPNLPVTVEQSFIPKVTIQTVHYEIFGSTAEQLRSQMNQMGPEDPRFGKRFYGNTTASIRFGYGYSIFGTRCQISSAEVNSSVIVTLPKWNIPANVSPQLIRNWSRFITALKLHEDGHKNYIIEASNKILDALKDLPDSPKCNSLGDLANATGQKIIKEYNERNIRYDRTTRHGATQGAVFP